MEKEGMRASDSNGNNNTNANNSTTTIINSSNPRDRSVAVAASSSRPNSEIPHNKPTTSSSSCDFVLQWGSRKRLRFMKVQVKDVSSSPLHKTTVRRIVRTDASNPSNGLTPPKTNFSNGNGYFNLRQRPSASPPPPPHRVLRNNTEASAAAMRAQSVNGCGGGAGVRGLTSPEREKRGAANNHINGHNENNKSSETANDSKKGGCSSGSGGDAAPPVVWPPKLLITLTNKEKEEDFYAFKGTKLPQRPKKRAKFIQRTVNLVTPGQWLCDLTLERYEVREKKTSKKRPRGLKAMNNMESDSE